jgi:3-phenylpropionate/cinnamic acid dioxygenase small subunit
VLDAQTLIQIDALQTRYIRALDRKDMQAWLACFDESGSYICNSRENTDGGMQLAIMLDDCRARLKDRVKFITEVWSGTFEDYDVRHFVQRLDAKELEDGMVKVESNVLVVQTNVEGRTEILVSGLYVDTVGLAGEQPLFRSKSAILDDVTTSRYLVYPI